MAQRVEVFDVECPASTPASAPIEVLTPFDAGVVRKVFIVIPSGHAGLTGVALAVSHQPVIPFNRKANPTAVWKFIEGDNEVLPIELDGEPDSGAWSVWLFNADLQKHAWQLRFLVDELPRTLIPPVSRPVTAAQIEQAGAGEGEPPAGEPPGEPPSAGEAPEGEAPAPGEPGETPLAPEPETPPETPIGEPPLDLGGAPAEPEPEGGLTINLDGEVESEPGEGSTGGTPAPGSTSHTGGKSGKGRRPPAPKSKVKVTHLVLPAGGWLPHGARYTVERVDQGQDGITAWRGPIIAPGPGHLLHNLSDRPFPNGFGPRYAVLHIDSGRFAGDWYVGHCTSALSRNGQPFKQGDVVAHADQGNVQGGGWFEIGAAPGGIPGPMGDGAKYAHLFSPLTITHTERVTVRSGGKKPPTKGHHVQSPPHPRRKAPAAGSHRPGRPARPPAAPAGGKRRAPAPPASHTGGTHPGPGRSPAGSHTGSRPSPRRPPAPAHPAPPPARRAPVPPPPPPARRPPPPPVRRKR